MSDSRVVRPAGGGWEVASALVRGTSSSTHATQTEAIDAARLQLARTGGEIRICGRDGLIRRTIRTPARPTTPTATQSSPPVPAAAPASPPASVDPVAGLEDAAAVLDSMRANAKGERFDADGDGQDDGEAVVTRILAANDGSPTSLFFQGAGAFITLVLLVVLPALAAVLGISIRGSEALGSTYWTVFVATLAWSGGIAFATFVFRLKPAGWDVGMGTLVVGAGFSVSSMLAALLGGATMLVPSNLALPDLYRVFVQAPKNRQTLFAAIIVIVAGLIWFIFLAGLASYGVVGLFLGAVAGVAIGLQAAHRVRRAFAHPGGESP
ncbi:DUF2188 domain-containing protein [Microbacterium sp. 3J1]|uniref:DUF2188 domain-containing protein n=1 Tax=Microbacterium sp. 3J1 TaxID=861269 RepID=UPI000ADA1EB2|nr:DUF2188 domain-containing protein [Microbacterium sp. 3J1]